MVSQRDRHGAITKRQIGWYEKTGRYSATDLAFNGSYWECYICHRQCNTVTALNSHLNSNVHKEKIYRCPNGGCEKEFISLAGLFNHLESESCRFMRFEKVQQKVGHVFQGGKLITF